MQGLGTSKFQNQICELELHSSPLLTMAEVASPRKSSALPTCSLISYSYAIHSSEYASRPPFSSK